MLIPTGPTCKRPVFLTGTSNCNMMLSFIEFMLENCIIKILKLAKNLIFYIHLDCVLGCIHTILSLTASRVDPPASADKRSVAIFDVRKVTLPMIWGILTLFPFSPRLSVCFPDQRGPRCRRFLPRCMTCLSKGMSPRALR